MPKVIIIGAGPSGLTCAKYLFDAGIDTLVLDNNESKLKNATIENFYPFNKENGNLLFNTAINNLKEAGVNIINDTLIDIKVTDHFIISTLLNTYESDYLVLGIGSNSIIDKKYKEYLGKGVSICAICDCPFYKDSRIYLTGDKDTINKDLEEIKHYTSDCVILNEDNILSLEGENSLEKIILKNNEIIESNNLFLSLKPNARSLYFKLGLFLDGESIKTNEKFETNIKNLYAIGDATKLVKQVNSSVYSGLVSALDIIGRIKNERN